jgi:SPP1 gp7 family putative phage head morphogenesis protein
MGTGLDFAFSNIDDNMVTALLNERWSGKNYSQRIWGNTDILAESLSEVIGGAMLSGQSIQKTARQIRERFDVGKYYAERLVRTETNHFNNEADAMAYEEMDVEKYVFLATLDTRTSTICQNLDNDVFELKERQVGVNYPPMHPNCRSKTRAYMGEEIEKTLKRRARNPITNETEIIGNMSYKEWYDAKVKEHGKDAVNNAFKKVKNRSADIEQFNNYKSRLTDNPHLPSNIDKFVEMKYNNTTEFQELTEHYRYKGRVPESTVKDFRTAKAIKEMGVKGTVRVPSLPSQRAYILEDKAVKRDPAHIMKRMLERHITDDDVQSYVDNALFSVTQFKGTRRVFYSKEGVTVLTRTKDYPNVEWIAKTTWSKYDFDEYTERMIKEAVRNGK